MLGLGLDDDALLVREVEMIWNAVKVCTKSEGLKFSFTSSLKV